MLKNYEEIKKRVVLLGGFVLMFLVGFGTGNYVKYKTPTSSPNNYTTKTVDKPFLSPPAGENKSQPSTSTLTTSASTTTVTTSKPILDPNNCPIKGNVSSDGRKLYHVSGQQSYKRLTHMTSCFNTEAEAEAAGFTKAKR